MNQAKPFSISKQVVWKAFERVKKNKGTCGIDEVSIRDFEKCLKDNLYKLWNRMSSGSYVPPPVRLVEIPKKSGGKRPLGIPTVMDRIAQMVVKVYLEPKVEPYFHPDSYGYRPNKSAIQAVGVARRRCWRYDWVLDVDIKDFFESLDHELLMKALRKHTDSKWMLLYVERWLKAPVQTEEGKLMDRSRGTPQGGVISPLLANLFLHYAFDAWMRRYYPQVSFERYADDLVIHLKTEQDAAELREAIRIRFKACGLELHPEKTKIVYCKDDARPDDYPGITFDFLGYTFRPRTSRRQGGTFCVNFSPAVSREATTRMTRAMRKWRLHLRSDLSLEEIAGRVNPVTRGWINYYGRYYKTQMLPVFQHLNRTLSRWVSRKYKRFRRRRRAAWLWLENVANHDPRLFAHWETLIRPAAGR